MSQGLCHTPIHILHPNKKKSFILKIKIWNIFFIPQDAFAVHAVSQGTLRNIRSKSSTRISEQHKMEIKQELTTVHCWTAITQCKPCPLLRLWKVISSESTSQQQLGPTTKSRNLKESEIIPSLRVPSRSHGLVTIFWKILNISRIYYLSMASLCLQMRKEYGIWKKNYFT